MVSLLLILESMLCAEEAIGRFVAGDATLSGRAFMPELSQAGW